MLRPPRNYSWEPNSFTEAIKFQCDRNYGRTGGYLLCLLMETEPGRWELRGSTRWEPSNVV